jgi:hypothetical protein
MFFALNLSLRLLEPARSPNAYQSFTKEICQLLPLYAPVGSVTSGSSEFQT